jgi:hypothetical protein
MYVVDDLVAKSRISKRTGIGRCENRAIGNGGIPC